MSCVNFEQLPDSARLWIYGAEQPFSHEQADILTQQMDRFMAQWTAHKRELITGWQLKYNRFVMIGVDESQMAASGCSIDSMVHSLQEFERVVGMDIVDSHSKVFYRDQNQEIQCVDRLEFKQLVENGQVDTDTIVFNNTIQTMSELRGDKWEVPMKASWHMEAFGSVLV